MEYRELKELLIKANDAYYKNSNPIMSDYEFDMKLKQLEKMELEQGYRDSDSPTATPGSDLIDSNNSNMHKRPMLSLENTYNFDDVRKWYNDMVNATGEENPEVVVNPKWDGGSAAIRYDNNGKVYKALTRGSGTVGEDITNNIKYLDENVWTSKGTRLGAIYNPFYGEARGEIIMTEEGFNKINHDGKYQNARNLVAGTMKLLDIYDFIPRANAIKFYAYWLEDSECPKYSDDLTVLKLNGFEVGDYYICKSFDEIIDAINKIETADYDVAIDGAVMKLNEKKYWTKIGSTAKFPKWAKAYKYKQTTVETKVTDMTFEVGRTGKITPLCWFEPRFIDGSTIQKATLNNKEFYDAMDVAIGDTIEVQKAAAIIPQIVEVIERPADRRVIQFPTVCPNCGSVLVKHNEEHNDWFCDNEQCSCRIVDQIINYTHSIECDGFAEVIVERLHNAGILNSISDLYHLKDKKGVISKLDRLSENMANKLCENVEATKTAEFWKVLAGLGIPGVGPKTAKILTKNFTNIDEIDNATSIELSDIEDIGEITAKGISDWFSTHSYLISQLKEAGVNLQSTSNATVSSLEGKSFCITGALSKPRKEYESIIEKAGGKVVSGVSSKTDYLITNDKTSGSSKNRKAAELNIPVISEEEFLKMLAA